MTARTEHPLPAAAGGEPPTADAAAGPTSWRSGPVRPGRAVTGNVRAEALAQVIKVLAPAHIAEIGTTDLETLGIICKIAAGVDTTKVTAIGSFLGVSPDLAAFSALEHEIKEQYGSLVELTRTSRIEPFPGPLEGVDFLHLAPAAAMEIPYDVIDLQLARLPTGSVVVVSSPPTSPALADLHRRITDRFPTYVDAECQVLLAQVPGPAGSPLVELLRRRNAQLGDLNPAIRWELVEQTPSVMGGDGETSSPATMVSSWRAERERLAQDFLDGIDFMAAKLAVIAARHERELGQLRAALEEQGGAWDVERADLLKELGHLEAQLTDARHRIHELESSTSWRATAGLRRLSRWAASVSTERRR